MERLLLIANAEAGSSDAADLDDAVRVLESRFDVEVTATDGPEQLTAVLAQRGDRDVVVVGGDGSLHSVVNVLYAAGELDATAVGVIPLGTGNDFARGLGIPLGAVDAAHVINGGQRHLVDLLVDDEDTVVVNAVHAGIGADAGRAAAPWKWLGRAGYVVGVLVAGFSRPGGKIRVVADGRVLANGRRRVLQVGVGNGPYIGGGVQLTPDADPSDGCADILVSFSAGPLTRLLYAVHLRRGTHEERHDVQVTRASTVTLTGEPFSCDADGEVCGPFTERTWTVRAGAWTVLVPEMGEASTTH